jgi:aspartate/methionine/tyrosine aminotransferase
MSDSGDDDGDAASRAMPHAMSEVDYERFIEREQERIDDQRRSAIEAGRRKGGLAGAAMAGAMFAVAEIYEGPKKDDKPVTVEASSDPEDVDRDGIALKVGDVDVGAPALPPVAPIAKKKRRR